MALKLISEEAPLEEKPVDTKAQDAVMALLLTALKALSQRTIIALAALQVTLAIASVLFLAYKVLLLPSPNVIQVTGVAIYAAFVLLALWLGRK